MTTEASFLVDGDFLDHKPSFLGSLINVITHLFSNYHGFLNSMTCYFSVVLVLLDLMMRNKL